jgi:hypothetical protein
MNKPKPYENDQDSHISIEPWACWQGKRRKDETIQIASSHKSGASWWDTGPNRQTQSGHWHIDDSAQIQVKGMSRAPVKG